MSLRLKAIAIAGLLLYLAGAGGCRHAADSGQDIRETVYYDLDSLYSASSTSLPDSLTADAIFLSCAALQPEESLQALRAYMARGNTSSFMEFNPEAVNAMWGAAAWELYCVTGSRQWLEEAYSFLAGSIESERELSSSLLRPLIYGTPEYAADIKGYYPRSMSLMERFETISTAVNAERYNALHIAALMAAELGLKTHEKHGAEAAKLRDAINDRLWIPHRQHYAAYLYGTYFPIQNNASDAIANSLCILFGVANTEMAESMIAAMPVVSSEITPIYPGNSESLPRYTPTLFALAGAKVRNIRAFAQGVRSLMNHHSEAMQSPGIAAIVMKGFFGMDFQPDGIRFNPMVPPEYPDVKHIGALKYRDAVLDLNLHGIGDRIASFTIDSVTGIRPFLPDTLTGYHRVDIRLTGNKLDHEELNICNPLLPPPAPRIIKESETSLRIADRDRSSYYTVFVNGVVSEETDGDSFDFTPDGINPLFVDVAATDSAGYRSVSPRPVIFAPRGSETTVSASSITPRRTPLHLIKDRATASRYIELAARHNTRLTCYVNIEHEGDYFLTLGYSNGSERCGLRSIAVNEHECGTLICPAVTRDDWISVHDSNTIVVSLGKGVNKISLTYIRATILFNKLTLIKKP